MYEAFPYHKDMTVVRLENSWIRAVSDVRQLMLCYLQTSCYSSFTHADSVHTVPEPCDKLAPSTGKKCYSSCSVDNSATCRQPVKTAVWLCILLFSPSYTAGEKVPDDAIKLSPTFPTWCNWRKLNVCLWRDFDTTCRTQCENFTGVWRNMGTAQPMSNHVIMNDYLVFYSHNLDRM